MKAAAIRTPAYPGMTEHVGIRKWRESSNRLELARYPGAVQCQADKIMICAAYVTLGVITGVGMLIMLNGPAAILRAPLKRKPDRGRSFTANKTPGGITSTNKLDDSSPATHLPPALVAQTYDRTWSAAHYLNLTTSTFEEVDRALR